jgi:superfamily II DNA or RNA helicase
LTGPRVEWLDTLPPQADVLRDYQRELIARMASALRLYRRVLLQSATGSGKTHCIAALVAAAVQAGFRVLILATRTRLVRQIHERLEAFQIDHGVLAAALPGMVDRFQFVQVASVDTLYRRCLVDARMALPPAEVVVFDEAHLAMGDSRRKLLDCYPDAQLFGFTATPAMISGRPLAKQFDVLILGPTVRSLIDIEMLVKPRVFNRPVVSERELKGVAKDSKTGDFVTGELADLMSRPKLVGDVVTNWLRIANGKRTLVFTVDKAHGAQVLMEFRQAGIPCEQLTDQDDETTREECIGRLERGETQILVNCFLLSYGIDIPGVECIVLARPTRSVVLYLQAVGRGMRPAPGKDSVIIIDHGRVVENLGMPTAEQYWSLHDGNVNQQARDKQINPRIQTAEKPRTCAECSLTWLTTDDGHACPNCGWKPVPRTKPVQIEHAELGEMGAQPLIPEWEPFYREACGWYAARWPQKWAEKENSGRAWAWFKTREKCKITEEKIPSRCWRMPISPPGPEVSGYLKSQLIRWAKRRREPEQPRLVG